MKKPFDLRAQRKKLGLTLEQIAARAGVAVSTVRGFEVGSFRGTFLFKSTMADAYEVMLRDLLTEEELEAVNKFLEGERQVQMSNPRKKGKD